MSTDKPSQDDTGGEDQISPDGDDHSSPEKVISHNTGSRGDILMSITDIVGTLCTDPPILFNLVKSTTLNRQNVPTRGDIISFKASRALKAQINSLYGGKCSMWLQGELLDCTQCLLDEAIYSFNIALTEGDLVANIRLDPASAWELTPDIILEGDRLNTRLDPLNNPDSQHNTYKETMILLSEQKAKLLQPSANKLVRNLISNIESQLRLSYPNITIREGMLVLSQEDIQQYTVPEEIFRRYQDDKKEKHPLCPK